MDVPDRRRTSSGASTRGRRRTCSRRRCISTRAAAVADGAAGAGRGFDEYVSDPNRPVPYVGYIAPGMTGDYMTEDQRFAAARTDVLVYQTPPLDERPHRRRPGQGAAARVDHRHRLRTSS